MNKKNTVISAASFMVALGFSASCLAQAAPATNGAPAFRPELIYRPKGNYSNNVARPLRYWPDGTILSSPTARSFSTARSIPEFRLPH